VQWNAKLLLENASNTEVGTTASISNLPAGTYTVTVTDNCSSQSNSVTMGQPAAALAIGTSSKTDASCFGTSTGSVTAGTVTGAVGTLNYSWKMLRILSRLRLLSLTFLRDLYGNSY
jgi:hypothetical protein